jgi:hypothetical protein
MDSLCDPAFRNQIAEVVSGEDLAEELWCRRRRRRQIRMVEDSGHLGDLSLPEELAD